MAAFQTVLYEERDAVAWVTLNRPEQLNAFNQAMQEELHTIWTSLQDNDDVHCVVLTAAGDRAFCTGIDRDETMGDLLDEGAAATANRRTGFKGGSPFHFADPGAKLGPKTSQLWKPVIAAVNGMACGGAFYLLGESDFIIAADHATFFDPHVTYGMAAVFEPIHMLQKMPFHEIMRISLLGNNERMSAQRAFAIGLVSEVVPGAELAEAARWAAGAIASAPPLAIQATVRALWMGRELSRQQALDMACSIVRLGTDQTNIREGQEAFAAKSRPKPRVR